MQQKIEQRKQKQFISSRSYELQDDVVPRQGGQFEELIVNNSVMEVVSQAFKNEEIVLSDDNTSDAFIDASDATSQQDFQRMATRIVKIDSSQDYPPMKSL